MRSKPTSLPEGDSKLSSCSSLLQDSAPGGDGEPERGDWMGVWGVGGSKFSCNLDNSAPAQKMSEIHVPFLEFLELIVKFHTLDSHLPSRILCKGQASCQRWGIKENIQRPKCEHLHRRCHTIHLPSGSKAKRCQSEKLRCNELKGWHQTEWHQTRTRHDTISPLLWEKMEEIYEYNTLSQLFLKEWSSHTLRSFASKTSPTATNSNLGDF